MPHRQLIGFLIVFILQIAALSFSAHAIEGDGEPTEPSNCEASLVSQETKKYSSAQLRVNLLHELNVKGHRWMGWQSTPDGRALLAVLNGGRRFLNVFEPSEGQSAIFEGVSKEGGFAGATWSPLSPSELVAGDDKGNVLRFDVLTGETSAPEFQGAAVDVVPVSTGRSIALGLGNLSRVRIMPVGSIKPGRDLPAVGPIADVKFHVSREGRRLAAVTGEDKVEVFDLESSRGKPVFSHVVSGGVKPQWVIDDANESALVVLNAGVLTVHFPLSAHSPITYASHSGSEFQALRTQDGEVLILLASSGNPTEILSLRHKAFSTRTVIENAAPGQGFVESPSGEVYVAYMSSLRHVNSRMYMAPLSDVNTPIFTLTFEGNEAVKNLSSVALDGSRNLLAVGTSANVYILELNQ